MNSPRLVLAEAARHWLQAGTERPLRTCLVQLRPMSALQSSLFLAASTATLLPHRRPRRSQKLSNQLKPERCGGERQWRSIRGWQACSSAHGWNVEVQVEAAARAAIHAQSLHAAAFEVDTGDGHVWHLEMHREKTATFSTEEPSRKVEPRGSGSRETFGPRIQTKKPSAHPPVRLRGKRDQNSLSLAGRRPTRHSDARLSLPLPPTDLGALRLLPYSRPLARGPGCKCQRFTSTARPAGLAVANWFSIRDRVECRTQTLTAQLQSADAATRSD